MELSSELHIDQLRELSKLISHAAFKKLTSDTDQSSYIRKMKKYIGWDNIVSEKPNNLEELIAYSYSVLEQQYRHEYIYKSKLLNNFVLKKYSLSDTILLNEFRIGNSIADTILINGTNKVFEIKTELDTPDRLNSQLHDYYKAFTQVYVFTHSTLVDRYLTLLPSYVGVLSFSREGEILEIRQACSKEDELDVNVIMGTLRKPEYLRLVHNLVGFTPQATPVFLYRACVEVLSCLPIKKVLSAYYGILKERISSQINSYVEEDSLPSYLNFSFYQQRSSNKSYLTLVNNLKKNIKTD